jgi:copper chaperone CopZ
METATFEVNGMSCGGCVTNLVNALEAVDGVKSVDAKVGSAIVQHDGACNTQMNNAITGVGFTLGKDFDWKDSSVWKQSAHNTKWCLLGCAMGEFATLAYFQYAGYTLMDASTLMFWTILLLPIINGLATSVALETFLLMRTQMDVGAAFKTAMGMSFIGMVAMEIAMEATDFLLTGGMGMTWWVIPPMLLAGFVTPWPYNYWRLKKHGKACH